MDPNPFTVLPAQVRLYLYLATFVAAVVLAAFQAAGGDWGQAVGIALSGLVPLLAAGNTPATLAGKHRE